MANIDVKADRRYTKDHEWAKVEGGEVRIGITAYAVDQLGDITLVNLDVQEGATVSAGSAFGTIESVKTLSDLFAPISGKIVKLNAELDAKPETINDDCYGAWMVAIEPSDPNEVEQLMDAAAYTDLLKTLD